MKGINISDKKDSFCQAILSGKKTIETRRKPTLNCVVGKRVALVQTGRGKAKVFGYCTIGKPKFYATAREFVKDYDLHQVAEGSSFFPGENESKYGYPLIDFHPCVPYEPKGKGIIIRNV